MKTLRLPAVAAGILLALGAIAQPLPPGTIGPATTPGVDVVTNDYFGRVPFIPNTNHFYVQSTFTATFNSVGPGFAITNNQAYNAWCADPAGPFMGVSGTTTENYNLYSSLNPGIIPANFTLTGTWGSINWLLNNKPLPNTGTSDQALFNVGVVQQVLWKIITGNFETDERWTTELDGLGVGSSATAYNALYSAALAHSTYVPPPGAIFAVLMYVDGDHTNNSLQDLLMEAQVPPSIILKKVPTPSTFSKVGDVITFTYTITNNGTTPAAEPFTITDDHLGTITCPAAKPGPAPKGPPPPPANLAPGASISCSTTYTITAKDLAACIVNTAVAKNGTLTSNTTTATICPIVICSFAYPYGTAPALTSVVFNESTVLQSFAYDAVGKRIILWATDEHAPTLGVREVDVKTSGGTAKTMFPFSSFAGGASGATQLAPLVGTTALTGDYAGTDTATQSAAYLFADKGRPIWPSLFVTDITLNPASIAGDWQQQGGNPAIPPDAIYGSWKGAVRTVDKTKTPAGAPSGTPTITVTPDADPAKNTWAGILDPTPGQSLGYGLEAVWNLTSLGTVPGHNYRFQIMVHDGDQNKVGGDVGEACVQVNNIQP